MCYMIYVCIHMYIYIYDICVRYRLWRFVGLAPYVPLALTLGGCVGAWFRAPLLSSRSAVFGSASLDKVGKEPTWHRLRRRYRQKVRNYIRGAGSISTPLGKGGEGLCEDLFQCCNGTTRGTSRSSRVPSRNTL